MTVKAWLGRLLQREVRAPEPPLDATARARLAHRKRAAERELRGLERHLKAVGCSTCVQQAPSKAAIQMERAASALRAEIATLERRLAA